MADLPEDVPSQSTAHRDHHDALHEFYNDWYQLDPASTAVVWSDTLIGDGSTTAWGITHNLNTKNLLAVVSRTVDGEPELSHVRYRPTSVNAGQIIIDNWDGVVDAPIPNAVEVTVFVFLPGQGQKGDSGSGTVLPAIESFGAVGDGVTDDSAAFVAAVAAGGARLGPNDYRLASPVDIDVDGVKFIGVGVDQSRVICDGAGFTSPLLTKYCELAGFTLRRSVSESSSDVGLELEWPFGWIVHDMKIERFNIQIQLNAHIYCTFHDLDLRSWSATAGHGMLIQKSTADGEAGTVSEFRNIYVGIGGAIGIHVTHIGALYSRFIGITVEYATVGMRVELAWLNTIDHFYAEQVTGNELELHDAMTHVTGPTRPLNLEPVVTWDGQAFTDRVQHLSTPYKTELHSLIVKNTVNGDQFQFLADWNAPKAGFFGATPVEKPTGVGVNIADVHAALVSLGLIET